MKDPKPLRWDAAATVAENARRQLPAALRRYLEFGDELVSEEPDPRALHRLRLATKHIRYSVEVFEGLFGPRMADLLKILRETQQRLGAISDATATEAWLKKQALAREPEAISLNKYLEERAASQAKSFAGFWQKYFGDPGERRRWFNYLERYAGRSRQVAQEAKMKLDNPPGEASSEQPRIDDAVDG